MKNEPREVKERSKRFDLILFLIPLLIGTFKLILLTGIPNGRWLGADAANYLIGAYSLRTDGYYSSNNVLVYWPAGYSTLIWLITKLPHAIWPFVALQTIFYSIASYYFVNSLRKTRLYRYGIAIALILALNPTLTLSSLVIGYENPIASCMLIINGIIINSQRVSKKKRLIIRIAAVGVYFSLSSYMQPRWMLTAIVVSILWALMYKVRKIQTVIIVGVISLMLVAPAVLIQRNLNAVQKAVISTNLGTTMKIGAGERTSGGFKHSGPEINCENKVPNESPSDIETIKCVIDWYLKHPIKTSELTINKSLYFWSPWTGPLANGTMAQNPWLKINPLVKIAENSQSGNDLVNQSFGKLVSLSWVLGGLCLLALGFYRLYKGDEIEKKIGKICLAPVLISWAIAIGTIGDHRFRVPTMPMSLFLQLMGAIALFNRLRNGSIHTVLNSKSKAR